MTTDHEQALFEAGIKLGALYHQWVGTPVSRSSAGALEAAIEKSHILQPFVEEITVRLDRNLMTPNDYGYSEVQGLMFDVDMVVRVRLRLLPGETASERGLPHDGGGGVP